MENQTPEVNLPPQQPKSNPVLRIVIGVAILAVGIGVGLAVGKYSSSSAESQKQVQKTDIPATSPSVAPTEMVDPTANWKTYANKDYGFSFSYPKELTYLYDHLKGGNILLQNFDGSSPRKELDSDFQMVITADDANSKPLEDYPKQWETELGKLPTETISIGGIIAIKGFSGQKYQAVPTVWFIRNNTIFMAQLSHPKSTNKIWFDQILSTFRFTN
jgi:hypothetical protein